MPNKNKRMANTLTLRLTTKGQNLKGQLAVECKIKGTSKRHYMLVQNLIAPVFTPDCWNEKQGLFIAGENAVYNNQITKSLLDTLKILLSAGNYANGKELFAAYEYAQTHVVASSSMTLGQYVALLLDREKQRPTANYELYNTLLNKLEGNNRKSKGHHFTFEPPKFNGVCLADTSISEISNQHFEAFGNWIKTNGCGYRNLMTTFKAVISKAVEAGLTKYNLSYKWQKYAPVKAKKEMTAKQRIEAKGREVTMLSKVEFESFVNFDVLANAPKQRDFRELASLYKDIVLLMYYTKSRPIDVLGWTWKHNYYEDKQQIVYTPHKLRLRGGKECVIELCPNAIAIIQRYKGKSKGGYIIPLSMNETHWDIDNPETYRTWNAKIKGVEAGINRYLKKWAKALKLEVADLSLYDFRHSAITHALNEGQNVFQVALAAGTSVVKIEQHYYNQVIK